MSDLPLAEWTGLGICDVHWAVVASFDEALGIGEVLLEGTRETRLRFHCMVISDGSRRVAPGERVAVGLGASMDGRLEASWLLKPA